MKPSDAFRARSLLSGVKLVAQTGEGTHPFWAANNLNLKPIGAQPDAIVCWHVLVVVSVSRNVVASSVTSNVGAALPVETDSPHNRAPTFCYSAEVHCITVPADIVRPPRAVG